MKKCLAGLLVLMLLMGSALAEGMVPVNTPITIDGVRVAFFDAEGNYLQPMEKEGLVWVPLNALCENLGKTAQVQGQSIMVDGVRIGMFDDNGNFLMPEEVNGVVYVPLKAFCQSAGIDLVLEGNAYAIRRAAEAPAAQVAPAPAPTAEPEPEHPEYAVIKLDEKNFYKYFSIGITMSGFEEQKTKYFDEKLGYWFAVGAYFHLNATATTPYKFENVRFTAVANLNDAYADNVSFGEQLMPQSGELTKTATGTGGYFASYSHYNVKGKLLQGTELAKASGKIYIPWEQAQGVLENSYQEAELKMSAADYAAAQRIFQDLAQNSYRDSKARAEEAGQKLAEQIAQKKRDDYAAAQAALESGDYAAAVKGFRALGNYEDSKAKLAEATEKKNAADYDKALILEAEGKYAEAETAFAALKDYKDSAQRLAACQEALNKIAYQSADRLETESHYIKAQEAFKALGGFGDSYQRAAALEGPKTLEEARNLMAEKNFKAAWEKVEPLRKASAEAEKLYWEANFRENGMAQAMSPEGTGWADGYGLLWGLVDQGGNVLATVEHGSMGPWKDGYSLNGKNGQEERIYYDTQGQQAFGQTFKEAEDFHQGKAVATKLDGRQVVLTAQGEEIPLPEVKGRTYWRYVGEDMVSFTENYVYGLMNLQGKVIVKAKYGDIKPFQYGLTLLKTNKGQALINAKGKEVIKAGKYSNIIILGEDMLAVQKKDNSKTLSIVNLKGKEYPKVKSNIDGGWIDAERQGDVILLKDKLRWWAFDLDMNPLEVYSEGTINVGYQNAVFHLDRGELNNLWNSKKDGKKALAMEGKNGDCKLSPDSPYILWKSEEAGWVIMDSDGNIIF